MYAPNVVVQAVPTLDRVLVKIDEPLTKMGAIQIANAFTGRAPTMGFVVAVGPAVKDIKVGDYVSYAEYMGTDVEIFTEDGAKGAPHKLLLEKEIQIVITKFKPNPLAGDVPPTTDTGSATKETPKASPVLLA